MHFQQNISCFKCNVSIPSGRPSGCAPQQTDSARRAPIVVFLPGVKTTTTVQWFTEVFISDQQGFSGRLPSIRKSVGMYEGKIPWQHFLYLLCHPGVSYRPNCVCTNFPRHSANRNTFIQHCQHHGCLWPGDARSQGISSHDIGLFLPDHPSLCNRVNFLVFAYR